MEEKEEDNHLGVESHKLTTDKERSETIYLQGIKRHPESRVLNVTLTIKSLSTLAFNVISRVSYSLSSLSTYW